MPKPKSKKPDKIKIEIKTVKLSEIRLNPDNPRTITSPGLDRLVKSLQEFPDMMKLREIVVDETMMVLGGNMRLRALQEIKAETCIAKIVYGLTPEQKKEFVIKDNGFFGSFDYDILANGWDDLPLAKWGVDIPKAWSDGGSDPGGNKPDDDPEPEKPQIILCPKCGHEFSILKKVDE